MKDMNVLLTGHKGFIGSFLQKELIRNKDILLYRFDSMSFFEDWKEFCEPDVIVHCGAVTDSRRTDAGMFHQNTEASQILGEFAKVHKAKMIFFSSQLAYQPNTIYGFSKKYAEEKLLRTMFPYNLCILRLPNVFGDEDSNKDNPSVITKIKQNELEFGVKGYVRRWVHVNEVVKTIYMLLHQFKPGLYYVDGEELTIDDLLKIYGSDVNRVQWITPTEAGIPKEIQREKGIPIIN